MYKRERASATISLKSQFCINRIKVVSFVCRAKGRSLDSAKIIKILKWRLCKNVVEARAFISVCVYYCI